MVNGTEAAPPARLEHISSARRTWGDAIIVLKLLNEGRHRITTRVFGVGKENSKLSDANLMTLFVIAGFAGGLRRMAATPGTQVRKARSSPTRIGDAMLGTAAMSEAIDGIAGHPSRDTSSAVALIAFAVVAHSTLPAVRRSLHAMRQASRRAIAQTRRVWTEIRRLGI
jgi:hypothetical protein